MENTSRWHIPNILYLACSFSVLVLGINLAVVFLVTDQQQRSIISDVISPIIDVLSCIALLVAAIQSVVRSKRLALAWAMIFLAMLSYTLGDGIWAILEVGLKQQPFPSIADGFYLAYYPIFLIGILLLPERQVNRSERIKKAIDIAIVMVAAILGYWNFLIGPSLLSHSGQPPLAQGILLAYPVGDLVLFAGLLLLINNRETEHDDNSLLLLAGSIFAIIVTDSIYSYQSLLGVYASGGLLDIGWILSFLLLGLAGINLSLSNKSQSKTMKIQHESEFVKTLEKIVPFVPYVWLIGAYVLLVAGALKPLPMSSELLSLAVGGIILLVLVRQIITFISIRNELTNQLKKTNQELQIELAERNQAVDNLQKSERRFRALVEHSLEEISLVDSDGVLTFESPTSRRPLGYPPNTFVGHNLIDLLHPDERAAATRLLEQVIKQPGGAQEAFFRLRHMDGSWRWMEGYLTNLLDEPAVQSVVINYRDITQRKKAEEEIKISNAELSMLFELSHSLAGADSLEKMLKLVNRHAVESIHCTFARIALVEDEKFIMRAAYPIRVVDLDLGIGERHAIASLPYIQGLLKQNEPVTLQGNDPGINKEEKKVLLLHFAESLCVIPLRSSDSSPAPVNLLGLLMLGESRNEAREPFTPQKIRLAQSIGNLASIAIRRMLLSEQTGRRLQQTIALSKIDLAIISTSDMEVSLDVLLFQTMEQLKVDAADIWLFNPASQELNCFIGRGFRSLAFENARPLHLGDGHVGRAALERGTIHIPNLTERNDNPRFADALAGEPFIGYYAVPLIVKDEIKGVLELFQRTEFESNKEWLSYLHALANQAAIAIDNSSLFDDLQHSNAELTQAYDATIQGWSHAMDLRDKETEGHTQRVTEITMRLSRAAGIGDAELVHVRRGGLLHDMGKMGIPDAILLKPGPLTDEEWKIMRQHPQFAFDMLSPIDYLKPALDIPYCHHEKWDGTGYPRGLKGDQIPLVARLFAMVDVYDALTSDRPYRLAWPEGKVIEHIKAGSGAHFDPWAVELFLKMKSEDTKGAD